LKQGSKAVAGRTNDRKTLHLTNREFESYSTDSP